MRSIAIKRKLNNIPCNIPKQKLLLLLARRKCAELLHRMRAPAILSNLDKLLLTQTSQKLEPLETGAIFKQLLREVIAVLVGQDRFSLVSLKDLIDAHAAQCLVSAVVWLGEEVWPSCLKQALEEL